MSWSPVLDMLGKEIRFDELAAKPYTFPNPPMTLPPPTNGRVIEHWLTAEHVLRVHDEMVRTFGGEFGVKDPGMIDAVLSRMRSSAVMGQDPFPSVFDKAAFLMHSILRYHPFIDGQKRTGLSTAFIFLGLNGYYLWSRNPVDEVHFAIHVAQGRFEVPDVTRWIKQRVASREIAQDPGMITRLLSGSSEPPRRSCTNCRTPIRLRSWIVVCPTCRTVFEAYVNAGVIGPASGGKGAPRVQLQAGIRLASDEVQEIARNGPLKGAPRPWPAAAGHA